MRTVRPHRLFVVNRAAPGQRTHRPARRVVGILTAAALLVSLGLPLGAGSPAAAEEPGAATDLAIATMPISSVPAGQPVTVEVTVFESEGDGVPEGSVELSLGDEPLESAPLVNGIALFTLDPATVTPGTLVLRAEYSGGADWAGSDSRTSLTVDFVDHASSAPFYDDVRWLSGQGITRGNADGTFRPTESVQRQAMAAFLYRAANPGVAAPACAAAPFSDVPAGAPFCGEIAWLASEGISTGYADGTFRPAEPVSREAMAVFLYRFDTGIQTAPACSSSPFTDIPAHHFFCGAISWLKANRITNGNADGSYAPSEPVQRQAMAAFLHRLFGDAIGTLVDGAVEGDTDDVDALEVHGDDVEVWMKPGFDTPAVDGFLVLPATVNDGKGVIGRVAEREELDDGRVRLLITPAALDEVYETLRIVSDSSVPVQTPAYGAGPTFRDDAGWECDSSLQGKITIASALTDLTAEFDLDLHLFGPPELYVALDYRPQFDLSVMAGAGGTCQTSFPLASPILVSVSPPITMQPSVYIRVSVSAEIGFAVTAGTDLRYELRAEGTDVDVNRSSAPFSTGPNAEGSISAYVETGIDLSLMLAGRVGLSGSAGIRGTVSMTVTESGQTCMVFTIGIVIALTARLDLVVTQLSFALGSLDLPEVELERSCWGGSAQWLGTVRETWSGNATVHGEESWTTSATSFELTWTRTATGASLSGSGSSTQSNHHPGMECPVTTYTSTLASIGSIEGEYAWGGAYPAVGLFAGVDWLRSSESCGYLEWIETTGFSQAALNPASAAAMMSTRGLVNTPEMVCTGFRAFPVPEMGEGVQAILTTVTVTCETGSNAPATDSGFFTVTSEWALKIAECITWVDSDQDGMGDCEEFDLGRDTTVPG